ncbi:distal membrane-arm assembly complex protein 2 isoform X2 [Bacillus rossius redtenbacheri]
MALRRAGRSGMAVGVRRYCDPAGGEGRSPGRQRVPLSQREGEWRSNLGMFAPETPRRTVLRMLQVPLDWSPGSLGRWWRRNQAEALVQDQRYIPERHQILGSNLATAHFVVARGGAVRFRGSEEWVRKEEGTDDYDLPRKYVPDLVLEAVDASGTGLRYEGLDNFTNLRHLRRLSLAGSPLVDEWFLDRVGGLMGHTLHHLDVSGCSGVNERGLCALYRAVALRTLKVGGPAAESPKFQLACLMLEEALPGLRVEGVTYLALPDLPASPPSVARS